MIKVKRILAPVNDMSFEEVNSFMTNNYIGVFTHYNGEEGFVIFPLDDNEFEMSFIGLPKTLEELDEKTFAEVEEHINTVSDSRHLDISIFEAE